MWSTIQFTSEHQSYFTLLKAIVDLVVFNKDQETEIGQLVL